MTVDIIIHGMLGRMGREIANIVLNDKETRLVGATEKPGHPAIGKDTGDYLGVGKTGVPVSSSLSDIPIEKSVVIDFTTPESTRLLLNEINDRTLSIVIGTTGLSENDFSIIKNTAKKNAVLCSPNMSLGVNFLFYLTQITSEKLGKDFDVEIIEAHHRFKKDSPSGTAKELGEIVAAALNSSYNESIRNGRSGITGKRGSKEIGMHAVRGGDIVGDHTVLFAGDGERLELKHTAQNRATFAKGAVKAAKWLNTQAPGLYTMRDLMDF